MYDKQYERLKRYIKEVTKRDVKTWIAGRSKYTYGSVDMADYVLNSTFQEAVGDLRDIFEQEALDREEADNKLDESKLDKLTAGTGIDITDNIISCTIEFDDYYTKEIVDRLLSEKASKDDVYTKDETDNFLSEKQDNLIAGTGISIEGNTITCTLDMSIFIVVTSLPATGVENKIYLIPASSQGDLNIYAEYVWVNDAWEKLGELLADVDLSNYYTKEEADNKFITGVSTNSTEPLSLVTEVDTNNKVYIRGSVDLSNYATTSDLNSKQDKLTAGVNITISEDNVISASGSGGGDGITSVTASGTSPLSLSASVSGNTATITGSVNTYDKDEIDEKISTISNYRVEAPSGIVFGSTSLSENVTIRVYKNSQSCIIDSFTGLSYPQNCEVAISTTPTESLDFSITRQTVQKVFGYFNVTVIAEGNSFNVKIPVTSQDSTIILAQGKIVPSTDAEKPTSMYMSYNTFDGSDLTFRWLYKGDYFIEFPSTWEKYFGLYDTVKINTIFTVGGDGKYWGDQVYSGPVYPGTVEEYGTVSNDCWGAIYVIPRYFEATSGRPNIVRTETPIEFIVVYSPEIKEAEVYDYEYDTNTYSNPTVYVSYNIPFPASGGTFYPTNASYTLECSHLNESTGEIEVDEISGDINNKNGATFKFELIDATEIAPARADNDMSIDSETGAFYIPENTSVYDLAYGYKILLTVTSHGKSGSASTSDIGLKGKD